MNSLSITINNKYSFILETSDDYFSPIYNGPNILHKKRRNRIIEIINNEIANVLDLIKKIIERFFIQNKLFFF